ncbi:MAG TPA: helix-turn-helix domain-containing protein [Pseudonocardiaceae bacterium]|jgi:predicted DNA-binding transcriptional regulator AlpA|nr:helix-turn-helix domain-containing protein [Pseudonocardiaceae bacterium]
MGRTILTLPEVAELTRRPVATLRYWRHRGEGPRSFKLGRAVVYDEADVLEWLDKQRAKDQGEPAA